MPGWDFVKMHGLGNDYLFVDAMERGAAAIPPPEVVRRASDRHRGIGSDGVIVLLPADDGVSAFRMRIWNADGSEGEMCGNGLRCAVKLAYERGHVARARAGCRVQTGAGPLWVEPRWEGGRVVACREEMGPPTFLSLAGEAGPWVDRFVVWRRDGEDGDRRHAATAVSMGNPHLVLFVDEDDDLDVLRDGPVLERSSLFPNRVNVGFARLRGRERVELAVWERGSGATQACGTGAAACLAAGVATSRLERRITVSLPGGELEAEWPDGEGSIYLTGPAESVGPCRFEPS